MTTTAITSNETVTNSWFTSFSHIDEMKTQILQRWVNIEYDVKQVAALTDAYLEAIEEAKKPLIAIVNIELEKDSLE